MQKDANIKNSLNTFNIYNNGLGKYSTPFKNLCCALFIILLTQGKYVLNFYHNSFFWLMQQIFIQLIDQLSDCPNSLDRQSDP